MRFDPKLIHPDEAPLAADGEIDLHDELAALAEQLRDDATYLAARYPATGNVSPLLRGTPNPSVRLKSGGAKDPSSRRRAAIVAGAVSGCALALALAVAGVWLMPGPLADMAEGQAAIAATAVERPAAAAALVHPSSHPATVSLADLSTPELEALLDLWQEEPGRGISVSF
jgi:hypothetical protein